MTSDGKKEVFVYLQLPGSLESVTAAKLTWTQLPDGNALGELVYGRRYLERASRDGLPPLDPIALPLEERLFTFTALGGLPGVIRDASPDYWGRLVIERRQPGQALTEIDYLLSSPEDRVGALSFGRGSDPPAPVCDFNRTLHLGLLIEEAERIQSDADYVPRDPRLAEQVDGLINVGTSMGGARPKAVVEDDDGLWLAKLPAQGDKRNYAKVEHGALLLAAEAGLRTPESRIVTIGGKDVLLVKRFDRVMVDDGYHRAMFASGLTVLDADESREANALADGSSRWSYPLLASRLALWSKAPGDDMRELFLRMAFNAMVTNDDDHPRNHGLINRGGGWRLSPLYDVVPRPAVAQDERFLALDSGDRGRLASRANLLSRCEQFRVSKDDAAAALKELEAVVARWRSVFQRAGMTSRELDDLAPAFLHAGFEY